MKNTIVKFGGVLPKILENTNLSLSLSGWPATIAIGFVCIAGVACYAIYEYAKQTETKKHEDKQTKPEEPHAKQAGSKTEQAECETEQASTEVDQIKPNVDQSKSRQPEGRQIETGQPETGQSVMEHAETGQIECVQDSFDQVSTSAA